MLKRVLFTLAIVLGFFMFFERVSATLSPNKIVYFNVENTNFLNTYNLLKPKIEEIKEYIKNNNTYNHNYIIYFGKNNTTNFIFVVLLPQDFNISVGTNVCNITAFTYTGVGGYLRAGCHTNITTKTYTFDANSDFSELKQDLTKPYNSISNKSAGDRYYQIISLPSFSFNNNVFNYFNSISNKFVLPYTSTIKLYNYGETGSMSSNYFEYYSVKIGEQTLQVGTTDYLEPSENYIEPKPKLYKKLSKQFNNYLYSVDTYIDKIDNMRDLTFKIDYLKNDNSDINTSLYGVQVYGLRNNNGLYNWEMVDDCTNWDFPSEYCDVKLKYETEEIPLVGFSVNGYIDFLNVFNKYDKIRIVTRLDNAFNGTIEYYDSDNGLATYDTELNFFGFDYSRNLNDSNLNRYVVFTTQENILTDNLFIITPDSEIFVDYFDTKYAIFREYSKIVPRKNFIPNSYIFTYEDIGLNNNLGFYLLTDKNRTEQLIYSFYTKPNIYFSFNNNNNLNNTIYIDNTGNITTGKIEITPDELNDYEYNDISDLFQNIKNFNETIKDATDEIHKLIQYAYDSLNIYIKSFIIAIFTTILVSATIKLIRK